MVQNAGLKMLGSFKQANRRTFADLAREAGYPTDLGGYYLRQLVASGYLEKGERGEYVLTPKGRAHISRTHTTARMTPRLHVLLIPRLEDDVMVLQRTQQPFIQRKEWPATALMGGEQVDFAVQRLLGERLTPAVEISFAGTFRRLDYYGGELFDDKVFLVHTVRLGHEPQPEVVNGQLLRVATKALPEQTNKAPSLLDIHNYAEDSDRPPLLERRYELTYEDFEAPT